MGDCRPLQLNELERLIKRVKYRDHPLDLLVLSSCQSAVGDEQARLGLAGLAVKSGARSAIGSLWEVDDRAAAQVMTLFHEALADGDVGKAAALQAAALTTRSIPGFELPKYWAPFQLVGDWR
jgi:CHAT domain-containing protein